MTWWAPHWQLAIQKMQSKWGNFLITNNTKQSVNYKTKSSRVEWSPFGWLVDITFLRGQMSWPPLFPGVVCTLFIHWLINNAAPASPHHSQESSLFICNCQLRAHIHVRICSPIRAARYSLHFSHFYWKIDKNNHKIFIIFTINSLNFFLSTLAKHTLFSSNYPYLQTKNNFLSPILSNQIRLCTLELSPATAKGNGKRRRRTVKMKSYHNPSGSNTNRHHWVVWVIFQWDYLLRVVGQSVFWYDRRLSHEPM